MKHGGTGFGKRDYSIFKFNVFEENVRKAFENYNNPRDRFYGIISAFNNALGGVPLTKDTIFVCKAPHNELYINEWNKMLGVNVKYIISTRQPTEHFLSLKNVDKMRDKPHHKSAFQYVSKVNNRIKLWNNYPNERTLILDYDALLNNTKKTLRTICQHLKINFNESLLTPSKMGVPWAGNSSRGIVQEKIFKNEHRAHELLQKKEIEIIEIGLDSLYKKMEWTKLSSVKRFSEIRYRISIHISKYIYNLKRSIYKLAASVLSDNIKNRIKTIAKSRL